MTYRAPRLFAAIATALLMTAASAVLAQGVSVNQIRNFELTTDVFQKFAVATRALNREFERDPSLLSSLEDDEEAHEEAHEEESVGSSEAVQEMIEALESEPVTRRAIEDSGLSVRDYALVNATLIPATIIAQMRMAGLGGEQMPDWISPQHVDFAQRHAGEIQQLFEGLQ
jgi:hypothetical protein